jgi:thiamine transport system substrate-binding protein
LKHEQGDTIAMKRVTALILCSIVLAACGGSPATPTAAPTQAATQTPGQAPTAQAPQVLTVMTHDSFEASTQVIDLFRSLFHADVRFYKAGDAGTMLNKAILAKDNPLADVLYGVDNTFLSRALSEDLFVPYDSPLIPSIGSGFEVDPQPRVLPIDYGDVCLNYDKSFFEDHNLQPPTSLEDLTQPAFKDLLVVENPATSSPGLAFLLATIGHFGTGNYLDYWQGLVDNNLLVDNDWETAYYSDFTVHGGQRPVVVSYASSPPAEVAFASPPISEPPTGVVTENTSCFRQIEYAGILKGTQHMDLAQAWIDFMLSVKFQEDMPLNMFVFPVNPAAKLPQVFTDFAVVPQTTAQVSPDEINQNRDAWIQAWTQTVLR